MDRIYRIIDVNINRVSEGLRVLEDLARFEFTEPSLTEELRVLRHRVRKSVTGLMPEFLAQRDTENDLGLDISKKNNLDMKNEVYGLVAANFKRVQEGLRVLEESLKIAGHYEISKIYEECRYRSYSLEKAYQRELKKEEKKPLWDTGLYCLTAEEYSLGRSNIEMVKQMIEAGIKVIQYREKDKKMLEKLRECREIRELTQKAGVTFIINDNIDIAILVKADGIHLGQEDIPVREARELVGNEMIIGVSTHYPQQAQDAAAGGADYIGVGPIFETRTKKDVCEPVGLEYLDYVVKNVDIPFVAIGGIKEHNVAEVVKRGARCIAMVTEIVGARDIKQKINDIRTVMEGCQGKEKAR